MEILVVEDEAGIADFLARGLKAEGYGVSVAADGIAGERQALAPDIDLVDPRPDAPRARRDRGAGRDQAFEAGVAGDPA